MKLISSCYWQQEENASALLLQKCRYQKTELLFACICAGEGDGGPAAGYFSGQLRAWFRGLRLKRAVRKPGRFLENQAAVLERLIERTDGELAQAAPGQGDGPVRAVLPGRTKRAVLGQAVSDRVPLAGILCVGEACLLFTRGDAGVRLLNRRMGRPCAETVPESGAGPYDASVPESGTGPYAASVPENGAGPYDARVPENGAGLHIRQGILEPGAGLLLATRSFMDNVYGDAVRDGLYVEEIPTEERAEKRLRELGKIAEAAGGRNLSAVLLAAREEL